MQKETLGHSLHQGPGVAHAPEVSDAPKHRQHHQGCGKLKELSISDNKARPDKIKRWTAWGRRVWIGERW
jgi:hypothetical protein